MNKKTDSVKIINSIIKFLNEGFDANKSLEMTAKELQLNKKKKEEVYENVLNDGINSLIVCINLFINQEMETLKSADFKKLRMRKKRYA